MFFFFLKKKERQKENHGEVVQGRVSDLGEEREKEKGRPFSLLFNGCTLFVKDARILCDQVFPLHARLSRKAAGEYCHIGSRKGLLCICYTNFNTLELRVSTILKLHFDASNVVFHSRKLDFE